MTDVLRPLLSVLERTCRRSARSVENDDAGNGTPPRLSGAIVHFDIGLRKRPRSFLPELSVRRARRIGNDLELKAMESDRGTHSEVIIAEGLNASHQLL